MNEETDALRRRYQDLETEELLHLYRRGGLTDSAHTVFKEVLDSKEPGWEQRDERWLQADFESFLRKAAGMSLPDEFGQFGDPLFVPFGEAVDEREIQDAEDRIGASLPRGYKRFLRVLGPGVWCRANEVSPPEDVFAFDEPDREIDGFISIVQNVQGVGDHLAFNLADPEVEGERLVYYCSHDPFGHARVADSFEAWARQCAAAARKGQGFYEQFDDAVYAQWKEYEARKRAAKESEPGQPRRWWQLWR